MSRDLCRGHHEEREYAHVRIVSGTLMPLGLLLAHGVVVTIVIVDVRRRPESAWARARENRLFWLTAMVVFPIVGMAGYWFVARPKLRRVAARP